MRLGHDRPTEPGPSIPSCSICWCARLTKGPLRYDRERQELISEQAGLAYPIRDGIPIMLVDEARPVDEDEAIPAAVRAPKRRPRRGGDERG